MKWEELTLCMALKSDIAMSAFVAFVAEQVQRIGSNDVSRSVSDVKFTAQNVCDFAGSFACYGIVPAFGLRLLEHRLKNEWAGTFLSDKNGGKVVYRLNPELLGDLSSVDSGYKKKIVDCVSRSIRTPLYEYRTDILIWLHILDGNNKPIADADT